jgi:chromosome segregation ATPase
VRAREGEEAALQRLEVYQGEIEGLKGSVTGLDAKLDAVVDAMKATGGPLAPPAEQGAEQLKEAAELRLGMVELKKEQEASSEQLKATVAEQRAQMEDFKTILRNTARGQGPSPSASPLRTVLVWGTVLALLIWSYVLKGNCDCALRRTVRYTH